MEAWPELEAELERANEKVAWAESVNKGINNMMDSGFLEDHGNGNYMPVADPQRQEQLQSKRKIQKKENDEKQLDQSLQDLINGEVDVDLDLE